jgi:hypothetical protein
LLGRKPDLGRQKFRILNFAPFISYPDISSSCRAGTKILALHVTSYDFVKFLIVQNGTFGNKISNFGHFVLSSSSSSSSSSSRVVLSVEKLLIFVAFLKGFGK